MRDNMNTPIEHEIEDRVQCKLCQGQVWMRKDHLEKHLQKVHSASAAPKKSFTTYKAKIASNFPPKFKTKSPILLQDAAKKGEKKFNLLVRSGHRITKGYCTECGVEHQPIWQYAESTTGEVFVCSDCKQSVFMRSFGE